MAGLNITRLLLTGGLLAGPILARAQDTPTEQPVDVAAVASGFFLTQIAFIVALVVIIALAMFFATQRERRKQELIARFLEKGQEIPRSLLPPLPSRQRELSRGIWLVSMGLGVGLVLYIATRDWQVAAWSLILLFLSGASFLNAALFYRRSDPGSASRDGG